MNITEIRRLIKLIEASNLNELEIEEDGLRVRLSKGGQDSSVLPAQVVSQFPVIAPQPTPVPGVASPPSAPAPVSNHFEVVSPMVGTFYLASSPEAPPYVQVGDLVKVGQVLCILEAMKLMNEIEAEQAGRITRIAVENAEPVEFGQLLFLIEPD